MSARTSKVAALFVVGIAGIVVGSLLQPLEGQQRRTPGEGFAAVPGLKGGHDAFGPYDPVQNWPRPLAESLPDQKGWTWSQATDVFPESPDRVIVAQKGLLPVLPQRVETTWLPQIGPSLRYPSGIGVPLREAASATPSSGKAAPDGSDGRPGVDWKWEHVIVVLDRNGKLIEDWRQWDKIWGRPHDVEINPYDAEKHIWIVDADNHFVAKFTNDGKKMVMQLGTPGVAGNDDTHFARPTFLAFMPDGSMFLGDGYDNARVIKYDKNGKKLLQWGEKGTQPNERRPGYFNSVHGVAVDPKRGRVYINDRNNGPVGFRPATADEHPQHHRRGRRDPLGGGSGVQQVARVRPRRPLPVFVGHIRHVPGLPVGHPWIHDRQGRQPLHGRGESRPRPEVHAAQGCEPGVPRRETVAGGLVGQRGHWFTAGSGVFRSLA